jgi:hypothetical protein
VECGGGGGGECGGRGSYSLEVLMVVSSGCEWQMGRQHRICVKARIPMVEETQNTHTRTGSLNMCAHRRSCKPVIGGAGAAHIVPPTEVCRTQWA